VATGVGESDERRTSSAAPDSQCRGRRGRRAESRGIAVILDHDSEDDVDADVDVDLNDLDLGDDDEWLDGLRRAGLPVRTQPFHGATQNLSRTMIAHEASRGVKPLSAATMAVYQRDWQQFGGYCNGVHGIDPDHASTATVRLWLESLERRGLAAPSLSRRVAALNATFALSNRQSPAMDSTRPHQLEPSVKDVIDRVRTTRGSAPRRSLELAADDLQQILTAIPIVVGRPYSHPVVQRDRALLALGWHTSLFPHELVGLDVGDLAFHGDPEVGGGVLITIRSRPPTTATIEVAWSTDHPHTCPVRAAMRLTRTRKHGALFVAIDRHNNSGCRLNTRSVSAILKRHTEHVLRADPADYTSQSLRTRRRQS
jgi:site-specific recombinase XerD